MPSLLWLRRDLRLGDHPALLRAREDSCGELAVLFVLDPTLWASAGPVRRAWLAATLRALDADLGGRLTLRVGAPEQVVPGVARRIGATSVHVTRETNPYGARRDPLVAQALPAGATWVETGTPYAVGPGLVRTAGGTPFQVFTPFAKAWRAFSWAIPAPYPEGLEPLDLGRDALADRMIAEAVAVDGLPELPPAGEAAAVTRWEAFLEEGLDGYDRGRNRPELDATSFMSPYLKVGAMHPRTLLADVAAARGAGVERFVTELAWREFYADVLHHHPSSAWKDLRPGLTRLQYDDPADPVVGDRLEAWRQGRTGYPIVDAGMRQLLTRGWMHNRVRLIAASFLTKDLHLWWPIGARWFMDRLIDGDLASNNHNWQWVAGTGTDAAPYFRVFNPVLQGEKFDPDGVYVRRWVPELAHLPAGAVHQPWAHEDGYARGYPARIVDHAAERREALARLEAATR